MQYFAVNEVTPLVTILEDQLKQVLSNGQVATTDRLISAACVGWTVATIERAEKTWLREGFTHPIVHNGLAVYYSKALNGEESLSLQMAVETGYYGVRSGVARRGGETPQQVLSELLMD